AAQTSWRQAKFDPLLPRLELGYTAGQFAGGIRDQTIDSGGRGDGVAQAVWELRNLGAGDLARIKERRALYNEANFHLLEIRARVGAEVAGAAKVALARERSLSAAQEAVREALETWRRLRE